MKIILKKYALIIVSDKLVGIFSSITKMDGKHGGNRAMGVAMFPFFIFLRNLEHPMTNQWINHERIHLKQFQESLCIYWIISAFEYLYFRVFKKLTHLEAYRLQMIEQEAYLNQSNLEYLNQRHKFATLNYLKRKKDFTTDSDYNVVVKG